MIKAYLKDPVTVLRHGARDAWGAAPAPTRELALGFLEPGSRLVLNLQGEQVLSSARVLLAYDATLTHEDELEISGVRHPIVAIEVLKDFRIRGMKVYIT